MKNLKSVSLLGLAAAGLLAMAACENTGQSRTVDTTAQKAAIKVMGPGREVVVGDTATFTAESYNTYGRDAKIRWTSTSGKVSTEDGGRIARVRFDVPGASTVTATLEIDGNAVQTEQYDVKVRAVK